MTIQVIDVPTADHQQHHGLWITSFLKAKADQPADGTLHAAARGATVINPTWIFSLGTDLNYFGLKTEKIQSLTG